MPVHAGTHHAAMRQPVTTPTLTAADMSDLTRFAVPVGRALFAAIFVGAVPGHLSPEFVSYAAQHGVPAPELLVPFSGLMAGLGGLSILLGYHARIGALLIVLFLVPVTFMMHNFWALDDPMERQNQLGHFMKNLAMLGGALILTRCGSGPFSLDDMARRRTYTAR
jgi:putative oxidoreductase